MPSGSGTDDPIDWPLYDALTFLDPYIIDRDTDGNYGKGGEHTTKRHTGKKRRTAHGADTAEETVPGNNFTEPTLVDIEAASAAAIVQAPQQDDVSSGMDVFDR
jgi:hypothetical protein